MNNAVFGLDLLAHYQNVTFVQDATIDQLTDETALICHPALFCDTLSFQKVSQKMEGNCTAFVQYLKI